MHFPSAAAAAVSALASVAHARINGIAVPDTIRPGDSFHVVIRSSNYIQTVYDVAIAFGYAPGRGYPDTLGAVADSFYLGPGQSNQLGNIKKWITIPPSAPRGQGVVTASLMSLYGVSHSPVLSNYNVTVTFGDQTSNNYVSSQP
ncbi:hypothetical protein HRG_009035 [Hirsutella rhossiliensis]|uniref:Uncharacterized protein n=1 Tax=Hirsutella rhossiliensis TaxID=111463 RepID=A0A9P8MT98_9HYPO|nr:uncharacterized protein HRG_09035 [Hirsutella rhossiliensis]KAH0960014.1 hypothetical protein HRG_09035 [Hirsutella rhossiliensis]